MSIVAYIAVMAITTYLIRVVPFVAIRGKIKSRLINSVLYYIPYAVLSAMTFPAIFFATGDVISSSVGTAAALLMAFFDLPLIVVALSSSAAALITSLIISPEYSESYILTAICRCSGLFAYFSTLLRKILLQSCY